MELQECLVNLELQDHLETLVLLVLREHPVEQVNLDNQV